MVQKKELKWGAGPEGDITRATRIGNRVEIGNSLGIDQEQRRLLDREGESYAGAEGRQNEQDSNQNL